jgi:hypothetical protein
MIHHCSTAVFGSVFKQKLMIKIAVLQKMAAIPASIGTALNGMEC